MTPSIRHSRQFSFALSCWISYLLVVVKLWTYTNILRVCFSCQCSCCCRPWWTLLNGMEFIIHKSSLSLPIIYLLPPHRHLYDITFIMPIVLWTHSSLRLFVFYYEKVNSVLCDLWTVWSTSLFPSRRIVPVACCKLVLWMLHLSWNRY